MLPRVSLICHLLCAGFVLTNVIIIFLEVKSLKLLTTAHLPFYTFLLHVLKSKINHLS